MPKKYYKVDKLTGCWNSVYVHKDTGYGRLRVNGMQVSAHRYFYQKLVGNIPENMTIDHLCKNRKCCNPKHLEVVSRAENAHRRTKLTDQIVHKIKELKGILTQEEIAKQFFINQCYVSRIQNGRRWIVSA